MNRGASWDTIRSSSGLGRCYWNAPPFPLRKDKQTFASTELSYCKQLSKTSLCLVLSSFMASYNCSSICITHVKKNGSKGKSSLWLLLNKSAIFK